MNMDSIPRRYVLIFISIYIYHENHGDDSLAKTRSNTLYKNSSRFLLEQYIAVCGHDYLCDSDLVPSHLKSNLSYSSLIECPRCYCDSTCFKNGNCCPDVYFSHPKLSCDTVDILSFSQGNLRKFLLVNTCPEGTPTELANKCMRGHFSLTELLFLPPVTGTRDGKYSLTFKNKYCAECNSFHVLSNWMLNFSCIDFADFNYLSSYEGIIEMARDKLCTLSFDSANNTEVIECVSEIMYHTQYIDLCNTTGRWQTGHVDVIQNACSSEYTLEMHLYGNEIVFKNIFCFLCNPPYFADDIISECNLTTIWQPYDPEIERSCKEYPAISASYPYKNKFCQICNSDLTKPELFRDAIINVTPQSDFDKNSYEIIIQNLESDYFFHIFNLDKMTGRNNTTYKMYDAFERNHDVNLTNLFQKAYSLSQKSFCDKKWLPLNESVLINRSAFFSQRRADCYDFNFAFPATCYSSIQGIPTLHTVMLLDQCFLVDNSYVSKRFSSYCEDNTASETIYSYIPVEDYTHNANFKNIFCALCNFNENLYEGTYVKSQDNDVEDKHRNDSEIYVTDPEAAENLVRQYFLYNVHVFSVNLKCSSFIKFDNHVTLYSVLKTATAMGCQTAFEPSKSDSFCTEKSDSIRKCNTTSNWPIKDKDVEWACEKSLPGRLPVTYMRGMTFRNEFCILCNPMIWPMGVISSCNKTGLWLKYSPRIEQACHLLPQIYATFPFKNSFCRLCNTLPTWMFSREPPGYVNLEGTVRSDSKDLPRREGDYFISLRNIFSLEEYDTDREPIKILQCFENQFYDGVKQMCRNLTCYPGKLLNGSDCKPLLTITNNLRYVITMMAVGTSTGNVGMPDILEIFKDHLQDDLWQALGYRAFVLETMYLLSNYSCSVNMTLPDEKFEILVYAKIFVRDSVHRLHSEENLVTVMNGTYNISDPGLNLTFRNTFERRALHVPVLIHESNFEKSCYLRTSDEDTEILSFEEYRAVHVAPLLTCVQTTFSKHEYRLDWEKITMLLVDIQVKLYFDEFQIMPNGDAAVCRDRILTFMSPSSTVASLVTALGMLTTVCLIISIICLLITLLTYGLFKPLRTLPGKNNIVLIVTMLVAQTFVLIQPHVRPLDEVCIIVGSLSHYFWLCYFGSLIVCSVHMFRVFTGRLSRCESDSSVNKTVLKYSLFSLGIPAVVVLCVVIVSLTTTRGRDSGYSSFRCFIKERNVFIITMITPLVIMCTCNLFFFAFTAYKIKSTPKVQKNKADKVHFLVYIKLFALTGLTWTIQIIDIFLIETFLSYISVILNCTQGLFLFLSYVCNKRVFEMYKQKLSTREGKDTITSTTRKYLKESHSGNKTLTTDI